MTMRVLGISGSLRRDSYNTALLHAAAELMPEDMALVALADLADIPPYNEDLRRTEGYPPSVERLRAQIAEADALLIATPEYNRSIPGTLKNALDWASRPPNRPLEGKPAAIMGAATGMLGTVRAQEHLRDILTALDVRVLNRPEVLVSFAQDKFDAQGNLTDAATREFLAQMMVALRDWTVRMNAGQPVLAAV